MTYMPNVIEKHATGERCYDVFSRLLICVTNNSGAKIKMFGPKGLAFARKGEEHGRKSKG